jgi:hypothetical protein
LHRRHSNDAVRLRSSGSKIEPKNDSAVVFPHSNTCVGFVLGSISLCWLASGLWVVGALVRCCLWAAGALVPLGCKCLGWCHGPLTLGSQVSWCRVAFGPHVPWCLLGSSSCPPSSSLSSSSWCLLFRCLGAFGAFGALVHVVHSVPWCLWCIDALVPWCLWCLGAVVLAPCVCISYGVCTVALSA